MRRHSILLALVSLFVLDQRPALAADAATAPALAAVCGACHGPQGTRPIDGNTPVIGGQYADYLDKVLRDYRSGARVNAIMNGQAATLSDQDIAGLAAWFSAQGGPLNDLSSTAD